MNSSAPIEHHRGIHRPHESESYSLHKAELRNLKELRDMIGKTLQDPKGIVGKWVETEMTALNQNEKSIADYRSLYDELIGKDPETDGAIDPETHEKLLQSFDEYRSAVDRILLSIDRTTPPSGVYASDAPRADSDAPQFRPVSQRIRPNRSRR